MTKDQQHLDDLKSIRQLMDRSSRFISLSGWSGVSAGVCALMGAHFANQLLSNSQLGKASSLHQNQASPLLTNDLLLVKKYMGSSLFQIALLTLVGALITAFLFTWLRSRKTKAPLWNPASKRLLVAMAIPLVTGGVFLFKLLQAGSFGLIAPGCLLFYGLALVNASKYTLSEIKYLGFMQLLTGAGALFFQKEGLYFWAFGFGILHILYGVFMWWKYERLPG